MQLSAHQGGGGIASHGRRRIAGAQPQLGKHIGVAFQHHTGGIETQQGRQLATAFGIAIDAGGLAFQGGEGIGQHLRVGRAIQQGCNRDGLLAAELGQGAGIPLQGIGQQLEGAGG